MADDFQYDVFLSHSVKDKEVVRPIAERLRADGLRVWFEDWEVRPRTTKVLRAKKIEEGLERSRVLVLCMSVHALDTNWGELEVSTSRFRDLASRERHFILLRLDQTSIKGPVAQYSPIDWFLGNHEQEYAKLLGACRPSSKPPVEIRAYAFNPDGTRALTGGKDNTIRLLDVTAGRCLRVLEGHTNEVWHLVWSADQRRALSCSWDGTVRLWDVDTERCLLEFRGHTEGVSSVAWSADYQRVLSASFDKTLRLWDAEAGHCIRVLKGHTLEVGPLAWSVNSRRALSGSRDTSMRLWDIETGNCLHVFEGHTESISSVAWSTDERYALSGSNDKTVRLWEVETRRCVRVLEGHLNGVSSLAWSIDQRRALSGSKDMTLRLWDIETGRCLRVFEGHTGEVRTVAWSADERHAISGDDKGGIRVWELAESRYPKTSQLVSRTPAPDQVQYTNAKVLLVGESGAGKTGLSRRLALNDWQPSDSTVGAWATQWKLPVASGDGVEREIWLWDFGGQADQRLIHQLYMDETALAVLVFDGQKEDLFETLGQWDRDLTRASLQAFSKLLVAGRVDAGGLRVSRAQIEAFRAERGYQSFLETSAKTSLGCEELKQAILDGIRWEDIPWRSSPVLFKRLREEIVHLKDAGRRVLMRFNELREALILRLSGEGAQFTDEELKAVIGLLASPGVVWELKFGSWVLLQPERINAYAQAVIQTMREDEHERGCIPEERVLNGNLTYYSSMDRLDADEERFVLLTMHQTLVERGLCLREHTDKGPLLVFPSYYRRERPELVGHPAVLVSYRFSGFLDDIYATLVVRLHHTKPFRQDHLWRYAADFKTLTGKQLGVKLTRRAEGAGELEVYFDPTIPMEEKIVFSRYIHEHLLQNAKDVVRLRHYVCPHCGTPVGNREVVMKRLEDGKKDVLCVNCEKRIPLWDQLEGLFASPEIRQHVRELQEQAAIVLDNESKERALVGEVISTVALAGQICRELSVSHHGIDMEIEFKNDAGEAMGELLFLHLRSGDSYLRKRKSDGAEIFTIHNERHVRYWMAQKSPVLLVIRNSTGEIRWMEVRDWLRRATDNGKKPVKQIVFAGERFDVLSVRRWRDRIFAQSDEIAHQRIEEAFRTRAVDLSLAGLRLTVLPESLWRLTHLESLDISGNLLTSIPESLGRLTQLRVLNLSQNELTSLPLALSDLTPTPGFDDPSGSAAPVAGLQHLFLHENKSLRIPREILGPTWEEGQSWRGNREHVNSGTPSNILDYYFSTRGDQGRPLREVKLIVVGRGSAGKTSLVRRLNGLPLNPQEPETHGISISPLPLECSDGPIKARVWDFGGQHVLHAMHEFFLTARSVYLLVLGERDDMAERDATYWLQLIRSYAGSVPVVVALNKSHGRPRDLDRETLEQSYGPILDWIATECDERVEGANETIERLRAAITNASEQMPELRDLFPAAWWQIKNWLEEMPEPYLDFKIFHRRCRAYGERDQERQEKLSDWLHDLGIALNYSRDPRLRNTTVLRPDWLANGIYGLLRANDPGHREKLAPDAILTTERVELVYAAAEQLGMLRSADYPADKWPFLLRLMVLFQLAYPLDEKANKLLVPALLPLEPPPDSEEPVDTSMRRLRYEFSVVPGPLMPRFLVRMFSLIEGERRWRRGALLRYADARARVWSTQDERWVHVTASGALEDRDELLTMIRGTFFDLFDEYTDLHVVEQVEFDGQWVPRETLERYKMLSAKETPEEVGR